MTTKDATRHRGGPPPYGYARIGEALVARQDEAVVVRAIFASYLRLRSLERVRRSLEEAGTANRSGGGWTVPGLVYLLRNQAYRGARLRPGHPPVPVLVSRRAFDKCADLLRSNRRNPGVTS